MVWDSLRSVLIAALRELLAAEILAEGSLGRLAEAANDTALKQALAEQREGAHGHANRLQAVFRMLSEGSRGGHAASMKALLSEGEDRAGSGGEPAVVDAVILMTASNRLAWTAANYETAAAYAHRLRLEEPLEMLQHTMDDLAVHRERIIALFDSLPLKGHLET